MTSILDIAQWSLWKWPTPRYLHLRQAWCHFPCRSHRLLESQPCQPRSAVCGDAGCVASLPITPWSIASLLASTSSTNVIWICLQLCIMSIYIWLVVLVWIPLKNISQLGWLFSIYGKKMFQTTNQIGLNMIPLALVVFFLWIRNPWYSTSYLQTNGGLQSNFHWG